jgi:16S rRNA (cytosine967-C5)-methyltransferase
VYATCSILPSENEQQVRSFLNENTDSWKLEAELSLRPDREGFDGFYAARLRRVM